MHLFLSLALLLPGMIDLSLSSSSKPFNGMSLEESFAYLYEKLLLLENRDKSDIVQTVREEIIVEVRIAEKRFLEGQNKLERNIANVETSLSTKLQDIEKNASKQKDEILNILSDFSPDIEEMSEKLLKERNERLSMDNHILMEVHQLQKRALETDDEINNVKSELTSVSGGRNKTDMLEVKIRENRDLIHSCQASQRDTEDAIRKSMTSFVENLRNYKESLISRFDNMQSNLTTKIGNLENSLLAFREDCVNVTYATSLDKSLQNLSETTNSEMQSIRNEFYLQIKEMNEGCDSLSDVTDKNIFTNQSTCGLDLRNAGIHGSGVVGENRGSRPAWPWMAAVYRASSLLCGGSVIHRHFILTAAHSVNELNATDLTVTLGLTDHRDLTHRQQYSVRNIYINSNYSGGTYEYDVALLELEKPIDFNRFISPVCLPPKGGNSALFCNSGNNQYYKTQSPVKTLAWFDDKVLDTHIVRDIDLFIQPRNTCYKSLWDYYKDARATSNNLFFCVAKEISSVCGAFTESEKRSELDNEGTRLWTTAGKLWWRLGCDDTSSICGSFYDGGPAMQSHLNTEGTRIWTQVGILSWRIGCSGRKNVLTYFTHLQKQMPWVITTIQAALKR